MNLRFDSFVSTKLLVFVFAAMGLWLAGGCIGARVDEKRSGTKDFTAGWEAVRNREWGEAEDAFSRLMRDYPQSPEGYFGLGVVCAERQKYELAEALFRDTIRLDPSCDPAYANLGRVYLEMEPPRPEEARRLIEQALELAPDNGENHFAMAVYWAYCEDYPKIWSCVRQAEAYGYAVPQDFVEQVRQEEHTVSERIKGTAP